MRYGALNDKNPNMRERNRSRGYEQVNKIIIIFFSSHYSCMNERYFQFMLCVAICCVYVRRTCSPFSFLVRLSEQQAHSLHYYTCVNGISLWLIHFELLRCHHTFRCAMVLHLYIYIYYYMHKCYHPRVKAWP